MHPELLHWARPNPFGQMLDRAAWDCNGAGAGPAVADPRMAVIDLSLDTPPALAPKCNFLGLDSHSPIMLPNHASMCCPPPPRARTAALMTPIITATDRCGCGTDTSCLHRDCSRPDVSSVQREPGRGSRPTRPSIDPPTRGRCYR